MAASQFIALLESRGLLDPEIIVELNRQVEQSKVRLTPEAIAKLLVENGQLTRFQATKLVTELNESLGNAKPDPSIALRGGRPIEPTPADDHDSVEDLLPNEVVEVKDQDESVEVVEIEEVVPVVVVPLKPKRSTSSFDRPSRPVVRNKAKAKSAWESYRIIGYGFALLLLSILFVPLALSFMKGSADDAFSKAETEYKSQDYERALTSFAEFAKKFRSDERASQARVFSVLATIRQDAEKVSDPTVALKTCKELLPTIHNEQSLGQLRVDVTDVLLRIAEKFVTKAEGSSSISDRKVLIEKMNQHLELIKDPRNVGTQERIQNELRIKTVEENQNRLVREIQRGEELTVTVAEMTKSVEAKNVAETYELRRKLLRKYPQLESDTKLRELLVQATNLQQELVANSSQLPNLTNEPEPPSVGPNVILVNRKNGMEKLVGATVFLRIKGSIVAMNSASGQLIWRKHIGLDWTGEPKQLSSTSDSDVLISISEQGKMRRLASQDGSLVWEAKFAGRIIEPSIDGDDIFVTTTGGDFFCLDAGTGQARWGKKIPQAIDVALGGATDRKKKYLLGNHSNLYVISRASGKCDEVEYVGHAPSSIAVPPIWIQNQLILFENRGDEGADYCSMRVYQTNDEGLDIKPSQKPIRFRGHVVVSPQVDRRRIAVVTNLGEVAVVEVDALNPKDKVFKQVNMVENEMVPKLTWPLMIGNDLLLASTRLSLYQVQESTQKLGRQWSKDEGDQFTARPIKADDYVIHSRVVRGNLGVRVTAISYSTGELVWETDVGVPVTSLSTDGKGFLAVTAQSSAFSIDPKSFEGKQAIEPIENLGRNQREMQFASPILLKDSRIAILNQAQGNQLMLVDPSKRSTNPTRILPLDIGDALPANEPLALGNGSILVPLTNGQIAMIDPEKGKMVGVPFQPTVQVGERPKFLNPVLLADRQTVIVADQQRFMHKLSTGKQLRIVTSQSLESPLKGRIAVIKDVVVGVSARSSGDQLDFYESNELKRIVSVAVEGRFTWGPYAVEGESKSYLLAMSDIDGLIACDETGKRLWTYPLEKTVLVGTPILVEDDCILASTQGELIRVSLADGNFEAKVSTGEAISSTPLLISKSLMVPCDEGIVITIPVPKVADEVSGESR